LRIRKNRAMKRLSLLAVVPLMALPVSAHASSFLPELGSPFPTRPASYGITANDFNGDGLIDVAVVNGDQNDQLSNNVSIYLRQAGGGFVEEAGSPVPAPNGPNYVVSGEFGGDGRPDLAVVSFQFGGFVRVLARNPSNTGFTTAGSDIAIGGGGSAIATADFDGDGDLDLVYGNWNGFTAHVLTRSGSAFSPQETAYPVGASPRQMTVGDFNADGRPDLAVANWSAASVSILLRNAAGSAFQEGIRVPVGAQPWGVGAGDFNRDGLVDVAVANESDDSVQLLLNTGGGFTATAPVAVPDQPRDLAVADFDRDGTPDVAVASFGAGALTVLAGGRAPEPSIAVPSAYMPAVADFNADQRPDLAVTSTVPGSFASLLNTTPAPQPPPPPRPTGPGPAPSPPPTPLPDPVAGRNLNATPVEGRVKVKLPGSRRYVDLSQAQQLPVGTSVDARNGTVELKAAGNGGTAKFFDGLFKLSGQTKGRRPLTTLTLTERLSCPKSAKRASAAAAKKKSRKLWGDGKGAFRTKGRHSAATVRGTKWLVTDRCTTTTTRVTQGAVTVRDFARKRKVVVRAGESYTARAKRR
jgi:hypothetical protein